jgi:hypothetical protein
MACSALHRAPAAATSRGTIDLYWLPLGAGGHSVRYNGRIYEAVAAAIEHRSRCDLYHSALDVCLGTERFVIEMAPAWDALGAERGVVAEGPVGARWAARLRIFRYEIRCWRGGRIPDVEAAVESPQRLTEDPAAARRLLDLVPAVPRMVWGRDELATGEMWNSNSVVAWLLVRSAVDTSELHLPRAGRAPGWAAGVAAARAIVPPPALDAGFPQSSLREGHVTRAGRLPQT